MLAGARRRSAAGWVGFYGGQRACAWPGVALLSGGAGYFTYAPTAPGPGRTAGDWGLYRGLDGGLLFGSLECEEVAIAVGASPCESGYEGAFGGVVASGSGASVVHQVHALTWR
jgi:hypothetical protein